MSQCCSATAIPVYGWGILYPSLYAAAIDSFGGRAPYLVLLMGLKRLIGSEMVG